MTEQKNTETEYHKFRITRYLVSTLMIFIITSFVALYGNGFIFDIIDGGTAYEVRHNTSNPTSPYSLVIPSTHNGLPVIRIAEEGFQNKPRMTSITIPNSIISIGDAAFRNCTAFDRITIPNSVTTIGAQAFAGCINLSNGWDADHVFFVVTIPSSVTTIGAQAFAGCTHLRITFASPSNITTISDGMFSGCTFLQITLPNSVTTIGNNAFANTNLGTIRLPNSLTTIGNNAFANTMLSSITIPNSVTIIGDMAFLQSAHLRFIHIPISVTTIGSGAFSACTELTILAEASSQPAGWHTNWNPNNRQINWRTYFSESDRLVYTYINDTEGYEVSGLFGDIANNTIIPNSFNSLPVTRIRNAGFSNATSNFSLTIPNSVTTIGNSAFNGSGLTAVIFELPSSITTIGNNVFASCTALTSITIPNSVTTIGNSAFAGCTALTSITIPNSVTTIGNSAFSGCTALASIIIPNSVTSIGHRVFWGCTGLTSALFESPSSLTTISEGMFADCTALTSITIPNSVTVLGDPGGWDRPRGAFEGCTSLTTVLFESPSSLSKIAYGTFYGCTALTSITIPNSVTSISIHEEQMGFAAGGAFENCTSLTTVIFESPSSLTMIGLGAFAGCTSLTSISIPNTVDMIGGGAFRGTSLTSISIPNSVTEIGSLAFRYCTSLTTVIFESPSSLTTIGQRAFGNCTSMPSITLPNSVTTIGSEAFEYCYMLTSIAIPNSVTEIGWAAFRFSGIYNNSTSAIVYADNWAVDTRGTNITAVNLRENTVGISSSLFRSSNLTSITMPNSVTHIGSQAFAFCTGLTSITIPNSVISIGNQMFWGCTNLTTITFESPSSLTTIGAAAFQGCTSLTSITIPNSVTTIIGAGISGGFSVEGAFFGCTALTSVIFESPSSLTTIGDRMFVGTSLASITIPGSVTTIGSSAFANLTSLTSVIFETPSSLSMIGRNSFANCTSLTSIIMPNSVTTIDGGAFRGCTSLTSITIPNSVTTINGWDGGSVEGAFFGCAALTTVTFESPSNLTDIGRETFRNCTSLTSITIPNSVTMIGERAFMNTGIWNNTHENSVVYADNWVVGFRGTVANVVVLNENTMGIGNEAFGYQFGESNSNLISITIPNSLIHIGQYAFTRNTGLTTVTFESSSALTTIGFGAFEGCTSLTNIMIPLSVTLIGSWAFVNCNSLTILAEANNPANDPTSPAHGWESNWNGGRPVIWADGDVSDCEVTEVAFATALAGNYPNPFNPETTISFSLSADTFVAIDIYNIKGQKVRTLVNDELTSGHHSVVWNGKNNIERDVASGIYFYRMRAGDFTATRKMILMK